MCGDVTSLLGNVLLPSSILHFPRNVIFVPFKSPTNEWHDCDVIHLYGLPRMHPSFGCNDRARSAVEPGAPHPGK